VFALRYEDAQIAVFGVGATGLHWHAGLSGAGLSDGEPNRVCAATRKDPTNVPSRLYTGTHGLTDERRRGQASRRTEDFGGGL
jgi:hypothetical protein